MKTARNKQASLLLALLLSAVWLLPTQANSAIRSWRGADGAAVSPQAGCPVEVLREHLTVEIGGLPQPFADLPDASVTAEYTLLNPTEDAVEVRLFFPVGQQPAYTDESGAYGVTVNGKEAAVKRRFSACFTRSFSAGDVETDLMKLEDGYTSDPFWRPGLPVTDYTFSFSELDDTRNTLAVLCLTGGSRALLYDEGDKAYYKLEWDGKSTVRFNIEEGSVCRIAVFGESDAAFSWHFEHADTGEPLSATVSEKEKRELTLEGFITGLSQENSPVSAADRFNAAAAELRDTFDGAAPDALQVTECLQFTVDENYMEWYEYTLAFAPGETLTNTVTAPFFPDIDVGWEPPKYSYTYLLSPAAGWASFGGLDVELHTDAFLLESSLKGFTKTETGWEMHTDSLPEKELELCLSAAQKPKRDKDDLMKEILLWGLMIFGLALIAGAVLLVIFLLKKLFRRLKDGRHAKNGTKGAQHESVHRPAGDGGRTEGMQ